MDRTMRAGAGKEEIMLMEAYLAIEDFSIVHRALDVRAVIIENGTKMAFVSVEMTSLPAEEIEAVKDRIVMEAEIERENIWVCCTHTFSAPHLLPDFMLAENDGIAKKEEFRKALQNAAAAAVIKAQSRMEAVTPRFGSSYCDINIGRDEELEDGWWIGEHGMGLVDHEIQALRLDNREGKPVAVIFNYAIQSSVLDGSVLSTGGKGVSPDVAGTACDYIERCYRKPHPVVLFLMGAAGDQVPVKRTVSETFVKGERVRKDRHEEGFKICEELGRTLGDAVIRAMDSSRQVSVDDEVRMERKKITVPGKTMERNLHNLKPVKEFKYTENGDVETEIEIAAIGEIAFLGVKPELNCITAAAVKAFSPYEHTIITTMVNGASKYMADKRSYDRVTYEAQNSPFAKGAAEILMKESISLLNEMHENRL